MIRHTASILALTGLAASSLAQTCGNPWSAGATGPSARNLHAAAYDSARGKIILFGGKPTVGTSGTYFGDTWEWTAAGPGGGGAWGQSPATGPSARINAGMAYDSARSRTVLFGGRTLVSPATFSNETWEFDGSAWSLITPAASPPATEGLLLAYDSTRQRTVLVANSATWEYDGATWTQQADATPSTNGPATRFSIAYDAGRARMVLFGPVLASGSFTGIGVWERNVPGWTLVQQDTFPYYYDGPSRASYDVAGARILVLDVTNIGQSARVWSWKGPALGWTRLSGEGPAPLSYGSATFDAAGGQFVTVGGFSLGAVTSNRVDLYRPSLQSGPDLSSVGERTLLLALGGPAATIHVLGTGQGTITYRWRLNGVELDEGGGFSGTSTPDLTIDPDDGAHSGYYDCVVTDSCGTTVRPRTQVIINCAANCDGSTTMPMLNAEDFQCFLNIYASAAGLPLAQQIASQGNCDHSTIPPVLNANDFACFMNAFAAGCP